MQRLFDELEREARQRAASLETTLKIPFGFVDRHYPLSRREHVELRRLKAAAAAATNADTFVALCHGEAVPISRLNQRIISHHLRRLVNG